MLRLIVPVLTSPLRAAVPAPRLPALEKLVVRGTVTKSMRSQRGWRSWHLDILAQHGLEADSAHASAPLEWLGQSGEPRPGSWLEGEFVHLEMGSHNARLQRIEAFEGAAATMLRETLADHLRESGFVIFASSVSPRRFFVHNARRLDALCPAPDFDAGNVQELLPEGRDGAELRRLATEIQMLLHDHPLNTQRERSGLPTVNAVWFYGLGAFDSFLPLPLPSVWSDEPYVRGLCRLHGQRSAPLPPSAPGVLEKGQPGVVVLPASETDLQALEDNWFAPLAAALAAGRVSEIELLLEGWRVNVDRAALRRFWRRPSLSRLLQ